MERVVVMSVEKPKEPKFCLYKTSGCVAFAISCFVVSQSLVNHYDRETEAVLAIAAIKNEKADALTPQNRAFHLVNKYFWTFEKSDRFYFKNLCDLFQIVTPYACPPRKIIEIVGIKEVN